MVLMILMIKMGIYYPDASHNSVEPWAYCNGEKSSDQMIWSQFLSPKENLRFVAPKFDK